MFIIVSLITICLIFLIFFTVKLYKKNDLELGHPVFIVLFVLTFMVLFLSTYYIFENSNTKFSDYRYFFIGITSLLAFCSLLISSFWSTKTIKLTQETQKINKDTQQINIDSQKMTMENQKIGFVMDMIKNNYQLLKDKEDSIDALISDLDSIYFGKSFFFNKVAKLFHERLRANRDKFDLRAIDLYKVNQDKRKRLAGNVGSSVVSPPTSNKSDLLRDFKQIFEEDKRDTSLKILLTYFSEHKRNTSNVFSLLTPSMQKKVSNNKTHLSFLNRTFQLDTFIHDFLEEEEISSILERDISSLEFDEIKPEMERVFNDHYGNLGHFFRNSYRVVKFINYFSDTHFESDDSFRKTYLGVLRSYYSENVLLAIYYNSVFTKKGLGYAKELAKSDFFGDETDLTNDDPIHVRKDKFYFGSRDLRLIKRIFVFDASFPTGEGDEQDINKIMRSFNIS